MDWQMISAFGTIFGAVATLIAAVVALYIGLRGTIPKITIRGVFTELEAYEAVSDHPNCFSFECVNAGNRAVYLSYVLEGAQFKKSFMGVKGYIKSVVRRRKVSCGLGLPIVAKRTYWMAYPFRSIVEIKPGHSKRIDIPFKRIAVIQRERNELGMFELDKPLHFYLVDISGRKYRVQSGASPNSFLEERTCRMTPISSLTGEPVA